MDLSVADDEMYLESLYGSDDLLMTYSNENDSDPIALSPDVADIDCNPNSGSLFWCQKCFEMRNELCPTHGKPSHIVDKQILSRARASLPTGLSIADLSSNEGGTAIFTKRVFLANSIFGPFIAPETDVRPDNGLSLMIEKEAKSLHLSYEDEEKCNWMMFVRPAEHWAELNLMVFERNNEIHYVTTKCVASNQELRVGYSPPYAQKYNLSVLQIESQKFECQPCGLTFTSHIAKAGHSRSAKCKSNRGKRSRKAGRPKKIVSPDREVTNSSIGLEDIDLNTYSKPVASSQAVRRRLRCAKCSLGFDQKELMDIHSLSHVGDPDVTQQAADSDVMQQAADGEQIAVGSVMTIVPTACPACLKNFDSELELFEHIKEHSKRVTKSDVNVKKDEMSETRLVIDMETIADLMDDKQLQFEPLLTENTKVDHEYGSQASDLKCKVCGKVVGRSSALAAHMKSHKGMKAYYGCFICEERFNGSRQVLAHVQTHAVDGIYHCPKCPNKQFDNWRKCRKHVNSLHSGKEYPCVECGKVFSRPDKLRIHMITHTDIKEFMCDVCGRQFTRKDKLSEHIKRLHLPEEGRSESTAAKDQRARRFKPEVPSTDYHRFLYKCMDCCLGFKRRGMLINHLAKVHPSKAMSAVPELNLPILKTETEYYCVHCSKVYKSSGKRKQHMLRYHPGCDIPPTLKKNSHHLSTFTQAVVGNTKTLPYACEYCHRQYADKAKLTEHRKLKHLGLPAASRLCKTILQSDPTISEHDITGGLGSNDVVALLQPFGTVDSGSISLQGIHLAEAAKDDNADLLTHAMSVNELPPALEFQHQNQHLATNAAQLGVSGGPLELRILPSNASLGIDLNSLQIHNPGLSLSIPSTSISLAQPMQQNVISNNHFTPNLNSTASHTSPRASWSYQYKLN